MHHLDEEVIYEAVELSEAVKDISYFFQDYGGNLDDDLHVEDVGNKIETLGFELNNIPDFRMLRPLNEVEDVKVESLPYFSDLEDLEPEIFREEYEALFSDLREVGIIEESQASSPVEAAPYLVIIEEAAKIAYDSDMEEKSSQEKEVEEPKIEESEQEVESASSKLDKMWENFETNKESESRN